MTTKPESTMILYFNLDNNRLEIIKELREEREPKLTQEALAKILNTTQRKISRLKTGETQPKIADLKMPCNFYHVSADYIWGLRMKERHILGRKLENERPSFLEKGRPTRLVNREESAQDMRTFINRKCSREHWELKDV